MDRNELNYREDIKIERDRLDDEWLEQAGLYHDYGEALADAKKDMAKAHERIKICRADLIVEAKKKLDSPTVQEVEAYYRRHPDHKQAKDDFIDTEHEVNVLTSAVISFTQRKTALENLVMLWKGSYYATPREERDPDKPMTRLKGKRSQEARKTLKKRMKRRNPED